MEVLAALVVARRRTVDGAVRLRDADPAGQ